MSLRRHAVTPPSKAVWWRWLPAACQSLRLKKTIPGFIAILLLTFTAAWFLFPFPNAILTPPESSPRILDRHGNDLRHVLRTDGQHARPLQPDLNLADAGEWIVPALIAAEDKRFLSHPGVDVLAILRASAQNLGSLDRVSGASTLSTQVIRLANPRPRTFRTNLVEAFRALQLEAQSSKPDILAEYLNRAPFGGNHIGLRAGAHAWFDAEPRDLTLDQAALLAGLPQSPTRLRPDRNPGGARERRNWILNRMLTLNLITSAEHETASAAPLQLQRPDPPFPAPHVCDGRQKKQPSHPPQPSSHPPQPSTSVVPIRGLPKIHPSHPPQPSTAADVHTTLDLDLQHRAETHLRQHLESWRPAGLESGAILVADVRTGAIRAMVGSPDYRDPNAGQGNACLAPRSPGSLLKTFAYALAFDQGRATPASLVSDRPLHYAGYRPKNFSGEFHDAVTHRHALAFSLNLPALRVTRAIGLEPFLDTLRQSGFTTLTKSPDDYGLNLVLGGCDITLFDAVQATVSLAHSLRPDARSFPPKLHGIQENPQSSISSHQSSFPISREAAYLVTHCLSGPERGTFDTPSHAWKTGTSARHRDAWTLLWTPEHVIGVWLGNPMPSPIPTLTGTDAAAPLARAILRDLPPSTIEFKPPSNIEIRPTCARSGQRPSHHCRNQSQTLAIRHISPNATCNLCAPNTPTKPETPAFRILSPAPDTTLHRLGENSTLALHASAPAHWFANQMPLGHGRKQTLSLDRLAPGSVTLSAVTSDGQTHSLQFTLGN